MRTPDIQVTLVLEVSGAVLTWPADDPAQPPVFAFTDITRADWLWRLVGESGHTALLEGAGTAQVVPGSAAALRRLALGHWLRRWWPASARDGIMALDAAVLDAEIALLTVAADAFFTDDTLDSDVEALLAPHGRALMQKLAVGDPRVEGLVRRCADLAADLGVGTAGWPELIAALEHSGSPVVVGGGVQADYALAAGVDSAPSGPGVVAGGVASVHWAGVPAGVFDAAEDTVSWSVTVSGAQPAAAVAVALAGTDDPSGIEVGIRSGSVTAAGVLDIDGRARLTLPVTETQAWAHDWSDVAVTVGVPVSESAQLRDRVRALARARLAAPGPDAYLAEILAAESDY